MGILLSLPLLAVPSVGTIFGCMASCCGAATCSAVCSACGKCGNSVATRIAYAMILLTNSILSWVMLTPWAIKKLQKLTLDHMEISCPDGPCYGWIAVHRINFALGIFHLILGALLLGVNSSKHARANIQNGFWGPKIIAWLLLIIVSFLIPESFFFVWGNYISFAGATAFLLLGLILLVDLAHSWAEYCLKQMDDNEQSPWRFILVGSTLGMYAVSVAMTIVMYIFFASTGCSMNQVAISLNLIFFLVVSGISVHPAVQEFNPQAGLAQGAIVAVYCTYLTMSAVSMEPDDKHCNPLIRAQGTRTTSVVIGAFVTMLTVAYTTTRAATQGTALSGRGKIRLPEDDVHNLVITQPSSRRQMRAAALRQAIEEGSLPADALLDDSDIDSASGAPRDDEKATTQYNYTLFHIIFFLATAWVATLLTMNVEESTKNGDDFAPVGRTYWASWVKIVSAWACYGIYTWTLIAPMVLPERFAYD
ncbi:TPA membrane protein TMS1 [Blumeria hordei DH14]|uniref:TPA membrane protein TMS1 n=1 Tax=Blumeria graminis f. sp. hordei (strain DH14) TaxID=546991 RepID=N1J738_BLUG1|nr:TPA membrane protein TMS1 [Blumeria hordei DH14]